MHCKSVQIASAVLCCAVLFLYHSFMRTSNKGLVRIPQEGIQLVRDPQRSSFRPRRRTFSLCSPRRATFFSPRGTCRLPWFAQSGRVTECTKDSKPAPLRSSNARTSSPQRAAPRATNLRYGYTGALWRYNTRNLNG